MFSKHGLLENGSLFNPFWFVHNCALEELAAIMGAMKVYNQTNGCGVIALQRGGKKALVQAAALERAGIGGLSEGHTVSFNTEVAERSGKTAASNNQLG